MELNYDPRKDPSFVPPPPTLPPKAGTQPWRDWVAYGGAAVAALGSFLPWVTAQTIFGSISLNGTQGDGKLTLLASIVFALLYRFGKSNATVLLGFIAAMATLVTAWVDYSNVNEAISDIDTDYVQAQVGIGLQMVVVGAIAMLVGLYGKSARDADAMRNEQH